MADLRIRMRSTLTLFTLTFSLVGLQPATATILYPPTVPQPQTSNDIVGFNLQNTTAATVPAHYITFGEVFKAGQVPKTATLVATVNGRTTPVQMDIKTSYADNSVKMAVVTLQAPQLAANAIVGGLLSRGGSTQAAINLPDALSTYSFSVALTGGATADINVGQALATAIGNSTATYWLNGPLASQARVDVPVAGSLHVVFDVTAYADGSFTTDAQFNNDYAMQAVGGPVTYSATLAEDGVTAFQVTNLTEYQYQDWHEVVQSNGINAGTVNVQHDIAYLEDTGAVLTYDLTTGIDSSFITNYASGIATAGWDAPLSVNNITLYMPTTGGRPEIGEVTEPQAVWLVTGDPTAAGYALAQSDTAASVPWHYFDPTTGDFLSLTDYPTLWADTRGNPTLTQPVTQPTWTSEAAHQPDLSFIPYMLTGDRYNLDQLNAQATFSEFSDWFVPRQNGLGIVMNGGDQVRQQGWSYRQISEAAWANPDGSADKTYWNQILDNNYQYIFSQTGPTGGWTTQNGQLGGFVPGGDRSLVNNLNDMAPWQEDYTASALAADARRGNANAVQLLSWMSSFLVGRFASAANGFSPFDGVCYELQFPASGTLTWSNVDQTTIASGFSNNGALTWNLGDYTALAIESAAALQTIPALSPTIRSQAAQAYDWLYASSTGYVPDVFQTTYPNFHVVPAGAPVSIVPVGLSATTNSHLVSLTWYAVSGATSYDVYRGTSIGHEGKTPLASGLASPAYSDTHVSNGVPYYYTVAAVVAGKTSSPSFEITATPVPTTVPIPTNLTSTTASHLVSLTWTSVAGATSYDVYRGTSTGHEGKTPLASGLTSAAYSDTHVSNGVTYYYTVAAVVGDRTSLPSAEISATPVGNPITYPITLTATATSHLVSLTWTSVADASGYNVYRGTSAGHEDATRLAFAPGAYYIDTHVSNGDTYYYFVLANTVGGTPPRSNELAVTPVGTPSGLKAVAAGGQVTLTWAASAGAGQYRIFRGTSPGQEGSAKIGRSFTLGYVDTTVTNGTTYYYKIEGLNQWATSPLSDEVSATP